MPDAALPRVTAVVSEFPSGSETFIARKVTALSAAGLPITVLAAKLSEDASRVAAQSFRTGRRRAILRRPLACAGVLRRSQQRYGATRRGARAAYYAVTLLDGDPEVVHFEFSGIGLLFQDALELLPSLPVIVSCRGAAEQITPLVEPERRNRLDRLFRRAAIIHCVSDDMASTVAKLGAPVHKLVVNRPAVDPAYHYGRHARCHTSRARILSVGRLHWKKGYDLALLAVRRLIDRGYNLEYHMIGSGFEQEKLVFMIDALGLGAVVKLLGWRTPEAVRNMLEDATLLLLPSISEGISNAVLEAMAMEVPVVTTTAGGLSEVIDDGIHGFLAQPFDSNSLADTIERALAAPDLEVIGRAARRRIEDDFTLDRQVTVFLDCYRRAAGRVGP